MTREEEIADRAKKYADKSYYPRTSAHTLTVNGFYAGAKWADEHPKSPWIPVEERLPEDLFDEEHGYIRNNVFVAISTKRGWLICEDYRADNKWASGDTGIKYWMPIPPLDD